jgi:hypothetical protein
MMRTRVVLDLKEYELHLCGDPSVLHIVRRIYQDTEDELCEQLYERFKQLVVEAKSLLGKVCQDTGDELCEQTL